MWLDQTDRWLKEVAAFNHHPMRLKNRSACLLVIDMQNEFLDDDGRVFFHYARDIVPNVKRLIHACRRASIPVIFTGHVHEDAGVDGGMTAEWWPQIASGESFVKGTRGVQIYDRIKPRKNEKVIWKHRYSAFYETDLEIMLRGLGVTDLIITGVLTNVCCESTARDAFFRDYRIFFMADATAASEPEFQVATLKTLAYAFAYITTTESILKQITV
jgi:nicotinamidase-related amidase